MVESFKIEELLFEGLLDDYKRIFKLNNRSKQVVDELAKKIEEITNKPILKTDSQEEKRVISNNGTTINEDSIADIIDAFVRFRNGSTLTEVEDSNLSRVLITLNELVNINFHKTNPLVFEDEIFSPPPIAPPVVYEPSSFEENVPGVIYATSAPQPFYSTSMHQTYTSDAMMDAVRKNIYGEEEKESEGY